MSIACVTPFRYCSSHQRPSLYWDPFACTGWKNNKIALRMPNQRPKYAHNWWGVTFTESHTIEATRDVMMPPRLPGCHQWGADTLVCTGRIRRNVLNFRKGYFAAQKSLLEFITTTYFNAPSAHFWKGIRATHQSPTSIWGLKCVHQIVLLQPVPPLVLKLFIFLYTWRGVPAAVVNSIYPKQVLRLIYFSINYKNVLINLDC